MAKRYDEIAIHDPLTGDTESFATISEAKREAKRKKYTPVYIDLYDENGIVDDIKVENPKQPTI